MAVVRRPSPVVEALRASFERAVGGTSLDHFRYLRVYEWSRAGVLPWAHDWAVVEGS